MRRTSRLFLYLETHNTFPCELTVICSVAEPVPGWLDNFNGPIGMLVACGVGVLRTNLADPDVVLDFIPVDVTVQGLILAAYKVGQRVKPCNEPDEPLEVLNCSNANLRPVAIGEVIQFGKQIVRKNPFEKCLWLPEGSITRCAVWHYMRVSEAAGPPRNHLNDISFPFHSSLFE